VESPKEFNDGKLFDKNLIDNKIYVERTSK